MKTKEQLAEDYANKTRPIEGLDKHDAPFLTAFEHHEDVSDAFITGYEAATQWIPIEKPPEQNTRVFVRYEIVKGCEDFCAAEMDDNEVWHDNGGDLEYKPTHWLPIPKLLIPC